MAVPVHLFLTDDGGSVIRGSSDVQDREGSMELTALHHGLTLPVDPMTGRITGPRQHSPFQFTKQLDSASPYLFKAAGYYIYIPFILQLYLSGYPFHLKLRRVSFLCYSVSSD